MPSDQCFPESQS